MKYGLVCCKNDPITFDIVDQYRKIVKKNNLKRLYILVLEDCGNISKQQREIITKYMIYPYRKLTLIRGIEDIKQLKYQIYEIDESSSDLAIRNNYQMFNFKTKRYLISNGLYGEALVASMVNDKRFQHCQSVANVAKDIAKAHNLNKEIAYIAGLYHDIAKDFSLQEIQNYIKIYQPYEKCFPLPVIHQAMGEHILKSHFKLNDKTILKAVRHHCLGDDNAVYSKIIFIADKIDPLRGYNSKDQYELALNDIDKAFNYSLKSTDEFLKKKRII